MITPSTFDASNAIENIVSFCEDTQYQDQSSEEYLTDILMAVRGTEYIMDNIDLITMSLTSEELVSLTHYLIVVSKRLDEYKANLLGNLEKDEDYD
tara:strand:+ start:3523 stop:3810 length:288 start_codon:yes stop_codon:yes gene_type:complete